MDQARAQVLAIATEAQELLGVLPRGPVREALDAFAVLIATRSA
jgi:heptaprenyl diphosphate synthase